MTWRAYHDDSRDAITDTSAIAARLAEYVAAAATAQRAQLIGPGAHWIDVEFEYFQEHDNVTGAATRGQLTDVVAYYRNLRPGPRIGRAAPVVPT